MTDTTLIDKEFDIEDFKMEIENRVIPQICDTFAELLQVVRKIYKNKLTQEDIEFMYISSFMIDPCNFLDEELACTAMEFLYDKNVLVNYRALIIGMLAQKESIGFEEATNLYCNTLCEFSNLADLMITEFVRDYLIKKICDCNKLSDFTRNRYLSFMYNFHTGT